MFNDGLGFSPHARLNRVRERVPQRRSWSHLTRDCNGLFQRRSWSLTSRTIGTLQRRSWRSTSLTIEAKDFEEGLGVPPHLRQNPVPKLSQHKVLEFHLTYGKILFRSYLNTRSWSSTSLVAAEKNRRHNNKSNCSLGCNSRCVSLNWHTLRPKLLLRHFSHLRIRNLSSFLFGGLTKCWANQFSLLRYWRFVKSTFSHHESVLVPPPCQSWLVVLLRFQ